MRKNFNLEKKRQITKRELVRTVFYWWVRKILMMISCMRNKKTRHFVVCLFKSKLFSGSEKRSKRQQKIPRFECIQLFFFMGNCLNVTSSTIHPVVFTLRGVSKSWKCVYWLIISDRCVTSLMKMFSRLTENCSENHHPFCRANLNNVRNKINTKRSTRCVRCKERFLLELKSVTSSH